MEKPTVLLFFGMALFVLWLFLCLVDPWAGLIMSITCFLVLAGFIVFVLIGYVFAKRAPMSFCFLHRK